MMEISRRKFLTTLGVAAGGVAMGGAFAESAAKRKKPVKPKKPVELKDWDGLIDFTTEGISPFVLCGTATHLGRFTGYGEVEFLPGAQEGSLLGDGVVVLTAANGDLLVGVVTWEADAEEDGLRTSHIHFSWRDSVSPSAIKEVTIMAGESQKSTSKAKVKVGKLQVNKETVKNLVAEDMKRVRGGMALRGETAPVMKTITKTKTK
jgi:hypothetical protein